MKLFTAGSAKLAYPSAVQLTHDAIERVLSLTQLREKKTMQGLYSNPTVKVHKPTVLSIAGLLGRTMVVWTDSWLHFSDSAQPFYSTAQRDKIRDGTPKKRFLPEK